jgi:hypothetical protein
VSAASILVRLDQAHLHKTFTDDAGRDGMSRHRNTQAEPKNGCAAGGSSTSGHLLA